MALSNTAVTGTVRLDGVPTTATYTATPVGLGTAPSGQSKPGNKSGTATNGVLSFNLDRAVESDTWMPSQGVTYLVTVTLPNSQTWTTNVSVKRWTLSVDLGYIDLVSKYIPDLERTNDITVGESTLSRIGLTSGDSVVSGTVYFQYFTALKTEPCSRINVPSSGTAGVTLTTAKAAIFRQEANGDLTRLGITTNDTAMWTAANTEYVKDLDTPFTKYRGQRYAAAVLAVGTTMPTMLSWKPVNSAGQHALLAKAPRLTGLLAGQTDIPASVTAANVAATPGARPFYAELLPPA